MVLAAVVLTGCSPPIIGTIGIARQEDGSLDVLLRLCRGSAKALQLDAVNSFPNGPNGAPQSDGWQSVPDEDVALTRPAVAETDVTMPFDEGGLRPDVLYEVQAWGDDGNAFSGLFSSRDLAAIRPGEVLAPPSGDDGVATVTTPQEFGAFAQEFCDA